MRFGEKYRQPVLRKDGQELGESKRGRLQHGWMLKYVKPWLALVAVWRGGILG